MTDKTHRGIEAGAVFEELLFRERAELLVSRGKFLIAVGGVFYLLYWGLDWIIAPELAAPLLLIRLCVAALLVVIFLSLNSQYGVKNADGLTIWAAYIPMLGVAVMTVLLGGFASFYYIGIIFILFVTGMFFPWTARQTIVCGILSVGSYLAINLIQNNSSTHPVLIVPPVFFMSGAVGISAFANVAEERARRRDLRQRLQIEKANEELKELDRAKTRFFSNVSHELRTPLTLILGPLETILQGKEGTELRPLLEAMENNARRLLRQVNVLLDFARIDAGRIECNYESGNLGRILRELADAAGPHLLNRGIELRLEGLESIPDTLLDADKVETMAANLLSNAIKFTPDGGRIAIRAAAGEETVRFEVEDTGIGIPEDKLDYIFERFHQVDDDLDRRREGTGLGLAMVKQLARIHAGKVTVRSRPGEGSTFRVELPRQPDSRLLERRRAIGRRREDQVSYERSLALIGAAGREKSASKKETLLADIKGARLGERETAETIRSTAPPDARKVLVVEDNADLRAFVAGSLTDQYRVETAGDGMEGLEAARRRAPDIILSDIMMPRMDGRKLTRRIRQDPSLSKIPVILVTAKSGGEAVAEGLEVGASDYLSKPFEIRELKARVESQLKIKDYNDHLLNYQKILETEVEKRTRQLQRAFEELKNASEKIRQASLDTTFRLSHAAEYKDEETGSHIKRMGYYAAAIAGAMALPERDIEAILYAAPMHDVGKIGIPDRILLKPGALDEEEWKIMKLHTVIGANILSGSDSYVIQMAERIALSHHEKWDGSGYLNGLQGPDIPIWGRISAIADVFDALTTRRPYKDALPVDRSLEIIGEGRGAHFDPDVCDAFFSIREEILSIRCRYDDPASEENVSGS